MSKLPAFQFYPGDWRKDVGVQSLSYHDRGVWWEMLCLMHESEKRGLLVLNGRPMNDEVLARTLGLDKQILTTTITNLLDLGVASRDDSNGALMCRRMVRDENLRQIRTEAGKKGGNPVLVNQKPTTEVKQIPTPSSSVSTASSTSLPKSTPVAFSIPEWIDSEAWAGFEEMRKNIRAPLTDRARNGIIKELQKVCPAGDNGAAILDQSTRNSWRGIFPLKSSNGNGHSPPNPGASFTSKPTDEDAYQDWLGMSDGFKRANPWKKPPAGHKAMDG